MFEVIESIIDEPMRMFVAPHTKFRAGNICQLFEADGNIVCGLSDGSKPFGVVAEDVENSTDKFDPTYMIKVWSQRMVFRTDLYNSTPAYNVGGVFYSDESGLITTVAPYEDAPILGRLIIVPSADKSYLDVLWL